MSSTSRAQKGDKYYWRLFATGFCFFCFGAGGLVISVVVFPMLALLPISRVRRKLVARKLIQKLFQLFIWLMHTVGVIDYRIEGAEKLEGGGQLVLANHPSLIDIILLMSLQPSAACIVKTALFNNPFTWGPVSSAQYISNFDANDMIDACVAELTAGFNLVIFPEGSRTKKDLQRMKFRRGAAYIALKSGKPVVPVTIRCEPSTLTKSEKWYHIPREKRSLWTLTVEEPLAPFTMNNDEALPLQVRRVTDELISYFEGKLGYDRSAHRDKATHN